MYYPFLRGKEQEMLALRYIAQHQLNRSVTPILEPIGENNATANITFNLYRSHNVPLVLIVNPMNGKLQNKTNVLRDSKLAKYASAYEALIPAMVLSDSTQRSDLDDFLDFSKERRVAFVHRFMWPNVDKVVRYMRDHSNSALHIFDDRLIEPYYRNEFEGFARILLRDGFNRMETNVDYPEESGFSALCFTFKNDGYEGFGDYLTIGDWYKEGGGPAKCVALHLTQNVGRSIRLRTFLSDSNETTANPQGKYREARMKMMDYLQSDPEMETHGTQLYREQVTYPGLAVPKRYSIIHHTEIISRAIS